jgi:hypothetical protein
MRTVKVGLAATVMAALALLGGSAAFSGQAPSKGVEITTPTTFNRCAAIDAGLDLAIHNGPKSGPGHTALVQAEIITLQHTFCMG